MIKRIAEGVLIAAVVGFGSAMMPAKDAQALTFTSLFGNITISGYSYNIVDRHRVVDVYDFTYKGYKGPASDIDFTGYYIGTVVGENDKEADLKRLLAYYTGTTLPDFDAEKINVPEPQSSSITGTDFKITIAADGKSGTWATVGTLPPAINFYSIKGSNEFALYYVDPVATSGEWITEHLVNGNGNGNGKGKGKEKSKSSNNPSISHITVGLTYPATEVPEPATMLLFGTGLAGLAGARRKMKQ